MANKNSSSRSVAIILAAGKSKRFGQGDKLLTNLGNNPIIAYAICTFDTSSLFDEIIIVSSESSVNAYKEIIKRYSINTHTSIVLGGDTRQESVYNGLISLTKEPEIVVIHDGARPFVTQACIKQTVDAALEYGASTAGIHPKDIVKIDRGNQFVTSTIEKKSAWLAQTPQAFKWQSLITAHKLSKMNSINCEDDASLLEQLGEKVRIVQGDETNMKITTFFDLSVAEFLLINANNQVSILASDMEGRRK